MPRINEGKSDSVNYKFLNKIGTSIFMQNPPESLYKASNAWINDLNLYLKQRRNCGFNCLCQIPSCNKKAIDSHSIPNKNLRLMSDGSSDKKVIVLKYDYNNPFKRELTGSYSKSTLTFPGFCRDHDASLFQKIENGDGKTYTNDDIFFLSYRTLAKEYSDTRERVLAYRWIIENWNSNHKITLDKEIAKFQSSRLINLGKTEAQLRRKERIEYFILRIIQKIKYRRDLSDEVRRKSILKSKIDEFNEVIYKNQLSDFKYTIIENANKMAFSTAIDLPIGKETAFVYVISIPQVDFAQLIIACSEDDYEIVKEDPNIISLFNGDEHFINRLLNLFKDNIAIDGHASETENFSNPYFMEWDTPLGIVRYFKRRQSITQQSQ